MLTDSQDLLYIILSLSILWFTVFLCWLLYQAARVLRNANRMIESISHKLELINEAVDFMRRKVDTVSDHMGIVSKFFAGTVGKMVMSKLSDSLEDRVAEREQKKAAGKKKK